MWHPLRGVLEPFSEHRLLLARGHGSPYHQRAQNGYSAASEGAPRWRGSGRLQKRSVEHASHRRGPTSDSAILSELARCYCLHTARAQAACQGVDRQLTKPLACTAQWRKSANRMVKGRSPERRATARLRRKRTEAVAHLLVRRGAEADSARLGERFEEVRFVPEMERFVYRRRRRDA
jgi:hypothetical protein